MDVLSILFTIKLNKIIIQRECINQICQELDIKEGKICLYDILIPTIEELHKDKENSIRIFDMIYTEQKDICDFFANIKT